MSEMGSNLLQEWIRFHDEVKAQRDQLAGLLDRLLYEDSQTTESERIANRVRARAALKQLEEE